MKILVILKHIPFHSSGSTWEMPTPSFREESSRVLRKSSGSNLMSFSHPSVFQKSNWTICSLKPGSVKPWESASQSRLLLAPGRSQADLSELVSSWCPETLSVCVSQTLTVSLPLHMVLLRPHESFRGAPHCVTRHTVLHPVVPTEIDVCPITTVGCTISRAAVESTAPKGILFQLVAQCHTPV